MGNMLLKVEVKRLIADICNKEYPFWDKDLWLDEVIEMGLALDSLKTYEGVIPGHWIEDVNPETKERIFKCSNCGLYNDHITNYCDVCGAEMKNTEVQQ